MNPESPDDVNGLIMRDDVDVDFHDNFQNDYSEIFQRDCDFIKTHSNHNPVKMYGPQAGDQETYDGSNVMSLDQVTSILMGLKTVHTLVSSEMVQPTLDDTPINLKEEAKTIIFRIIDYIMNDVEGCTNNCKSFNIRNWDGLFRPAGFDLTFASPFIIKLGLELGHPELTQMQQDDELNDMRVAFQIHPQELLDFFLSQNNPVFGEGDLSCQDNIEDMLQDLIVSGEPVTIGSIRFEHLVALVDAAQDQNIDLSVGGTVCLDITEQILDAVGDIEIDIEGVFCDNLAEWIFTFLTWKLTGIPLDLDNIPLRLLQGIKLLEQANLIDESDLCLSDIANINDDNVHIFLELATISNKWSPEYINGVAVNSNMHWYPLLHAILHNSQVAYSYVYQGIIQDEYINTAPCEGPWDDPLWTPIDYETCDDYVAAPGTISGWRGANRLFHPGLQETGDCDASFRGEFSGLDYMLYYNLYHLLWKQNLPQYSRALNCNCVEEITAETILNVNFDVSRKFPDYKAKGIPIESYLAHSLELSSVAGIMDVKNDLIICRSNPDIPTVLTIKDGAKLNLYEGNIITVRAGNKIVVENGSELVGGIVYDDCCNGDATIILEENAELHIQNSQLTNYYGLHLEMKPGAKLIVDDGVVMYTSHCEGSTVHCHGGQWLMSNSTLSKELNGTAVPMNLDFESTITFTNCDVFPLNTQFNISDNTTLTLDHCEGIIANGGISLDHNSIMDLQYTDLTLNSTDVTFDFGSTLFQYETNLNCINNSALELGLVSQDWPESCHYYYSTGTVSLEGESSSITFDNAQLHIPANTTFQPIHPNGPSGYIEFRGADDHELITGTNSVFKIVGDGPNDLMLKMNGYADLWNANFGAGTIILQDCKVDLTDHGRLWTDMKFLATNVTFEDLFDSEDNEGGNVQVWHTTVCGLANCNFVGARLKTFNTKATLNNCDFSGNQSGYYASQGGFNILNSVFTGCHLESHSLAQLSMVNQSIFEDPEYDLQQYNSKFPCIRDESSVELRVLSSILRDGQDGIVKDGGKLTLKCNLFEDMTGVAVTSNTNDLNMSSTSGAGYNNFHLVKTCIQLNAAYSLNLSQGYNNLSGFTDMCIIGTMNLKCLGNPCELLRFAHNNYWGAAQNTYPPSPNPNGPYDPFMWSKIDLQTVTSLSNCNLFYPNGPYCEIYLQDDNISVSTSCGTGVPIVRPVRSLGITSQNANWKGSEPAEVNEQFTLKDLEVDPGNPLLSTSNFENIALDSALVYAALQMEIYDSLGNDANTVALFHEILTSPLDRTNKDIRWRMEWGRYNMKSAMENMFMQDELTPANNIETFETPVSQYVDVLNTMTDTILTDSTYKDQFYVEIDKGQLFRTLGNPLMARHIYMHLDDCQLDSLEQTILNNWRQEVDIELSLLDQYINDGVSPDSISFVVDTTSYTPAVPYVTSDYYFGVWIDSPTSATFVNCGDNPEYRILRNSQNSLIVYPNPSKGLVTLQIEDEGLYDLAIYDISGKQIYAQQINVNDRGITQLDLSGELSTGNYMIVIENEYGMMLSKLVIAD